MRPVWPDEEPLAYKREVQILRYIEVDETS